MCSIMQITVYMELARYIKDAGLIDEFITLVKLTNRLIKISGCSLITLICHFDKSLSNFESAKCRFVDDIVGSLRHTYFFTPLALA